MRKAASRFLSRAWQVVSGNQLVAGIIAGIVAGIVVLLVGANFIGSSTSGGVLSGGEIQSNGSTNTGQSAQSANGTGSSGDPRARIVELTGSWSVGGFVNAIVERETDIVTLYLKSGMSATILDKGASAILWGFQGVPQNGDPIALLKTFQEAGFEVDDELHDSYLMPALTDGYLPLPFETKLTPKGYSGGYEDVFVGSLLFWIVQRETWSIPRPQSIEVIKYLIEQGADCKVPLSFLEFSEIGLEDMSPYDELLSLMRECAS